jgi:uncharacterized membrane protein (UPF0182 family)
MDGAHMGELVVYRFPKDRLVYGPAQVMNRINQDAEISRQVSLWDQRGSQAIFGTLLVIPVEESLLYVSPLYLRSEGGRIPELKRVIVAYENRIAMAPTLDAAIDVIFPRGEAPDAQAAIDDSTAAGADGVAAAATADVGASPEANGSPPSVADDAGSRLRRAHEHYERAVAAQRRGDWATYGTELEALGRTLAARTHAPPRADTESAAPSP